MSGEAPSFEALAAQVELLDLIFSTFPDGTCLVDGHSLLWVNVAFAKLYGYPSPAKAIGENLGRLIVDEEETIGIGGPARHRLWRQGRRLSGETFSLELTEGKLELAGKTLRVQIHRDSSSAKRLRRQERLASLGTLAGGIAHEFNNILTGIALHSRIVQQRGGASVADSSRTIDGLTRRGAALVQQLTIFARSGVGDAVPIDLVPLMKESARAFAESLPPTVRLELVTEGEIPVVKAQFQAIKEIVSNLLGNARDAVSPRGGAIVVRLGAREIPEPGKVGHDEAPPGRFLSLVVEDDGDGIDEERLPHVFDPFHTTKRAGATGLGLSVVHAIVRDLDGWIDVRSRPGEGSRFEVVIPAIETPRLEAGVAAAEPAAKPRKATVVFADDEPDIRSGVGLVVEAMGHRVLLAADGLEAVELVRGIADEVDLVILDSKMPNLSGDDAFLRIHAEFPAIPVLLSSGNDLGEILEKLGPRGLFGVLPKPYEIPALEREIEKGLALSGRGPKSPASAR